MTNLKPCSGFHPQFPLVDCHCDTIVEVAGAKRSLGERSSFGHVDIPRLQEGGVAVQFFALYIGSEYKPFAPLQRTLEMLDVFYGELSRYHYNMELIKEYDDIERLLEQRKLGAVLTVEGGEGIQESLYLLRTLYRLGVRGITLTWNQRNAIADGAGEGPNGGLSNFGHEVVREMNRLGMLIDVSHINRAGFFDVVKCSTKPVIATHSNARALCNHPRNLDDEQLKLLADTGGVVGVTFVPDFLVTGEQANIERVADHIDYIKGLIGVDYIGIGSDFDGVDEVPTGLEDVTKLPNLIAVLAGRGYRDSELEKIFGGNVLRLLKDVLRP